MLYRHDELLLVVYHIVCKASSTGCMRRGLMLATACISLLAMCSCQQGLQMWCCSSLLHGWVDFVCLMR